jgi:hypothetical protein
LKIDDESDLSNWGGFFQTGVAMIYVDQTDKLKTQFPTELTHDDFVEQIEIESSWEPGYGRMTAAPFP